MSDTNETTPAAATPAATPAAPAAKARRKPREVHPLLHTLYGLYPRLFGARFLPLKLGVFHDLVAAHPDTLPKEDLKVALGLHTRSTRYLEAVAAGLPRHDLAAQPVEPVAPEHVHHAIVELYRRKSGREGAVARQRTVQLLAQAVEASGLTREDYRERFGTAGDEQVQAMLEEALGVVAQKNARKEALQRAFQASGKSLDDFAEMYGLPLKEAKALLQA